MNKGDLYISTYRSEKGRLVDVNLNYKDIEIRLGMLDVYGLNALERSLSDMLNEVIWRKEAIIETID